MRGGLITRRPTTIALIGLVVLTAVIGIRNATVYPAIAGYDAQEALDYANGVVGDWRLPQGTGSYYTPPGFFAIGGVAIELGEALGLTHPENAAQVFNALVAVGTLLLLIVLVRLIWPGRDVLHLTAAVFFVLCPAVLKSAAMFHPEPLSMLVSTAALVLAARILVRADYRLRWLVPLGLALGLGQLVRAWTLWTLGVVLLVLAIAAITRRSDRRRLVVAIVVVGAIAIVVPAPWYAHQLRTYDSTVFGQEQPDEPVWSRRPLAFFVGAGLPEAITAPYRPSYRRTFAPIAYSEVWGDYFGVWRWQPSSEAPSRNVRHELIRQSLVGLPFTFLAAVGWLALLGLAIRHPGRRAERQLVALLPLAALVGVLYFATAYPTPDGDTVKGSFMLTAVPAWAACFGFACDGLWSRFPRLSKVFLAALVVLSLVALPFTLAVGQR